MINMSNRGRNNDDTTMNANGAVRTIERPRQTLNIEELLPRSKPKNSNKISNKPKFKAMPATSKTTSTKRWTRRNPTPLLSHLRRRP